MLIMTLDHVREFFFMAQPLSDPMQLDGLAPEIFFSRWLTHICAPVFVLLTGLSAYLYSQNSGRTKKDASLYLLKRGLLLILLEATLINFAWTFSFPPEMLYFQIIWAIGFSMVVLSGLIWLPIPLLVAIGLAIILGHNALDYIVADQSTLLGVIWTFLHDRGVLALTENISLRTSYPSLPWVGVIVLGYAIGIFYGKEVNASLRLKILSLISAICLISFIFLRLNNVYGEANLYDSTLEGSLVWMSFLNVTKYPPSLQFMMMTFAPAFMLLVLSEKWKGKWLDFVVTFGRVPFFYYVVHLYVLHLAYRLTLLANDYNWDGTPSDQLLPIKFSLDSIYSVWTIAFISILALYPLIKWFAELKRRKSWPILSYL